MFDEIELTNCPEEYALNCKNYEIKCHECKANTSGKYLQYNPIDKNINEHPASKSTKKKGVASYSRKGRKEERKMIRDIPYLVSNYASGSIAGDGDAHINLENIGRVRVEIKNRFTENGNIYPSKKEYKESATQKVGIILIQHHVSKNIYAYMNLKLFTTIWRTLLFGHKDLVWHSNEYLYGETYAFYKLRGTVRGDKVANTNLFLGEEKFAPANIYKDSSLNHSRLIVLKDGRNVVMHINSFNELIDFYKYVTLSN